MSEIPYHVVDVFTRSRFGGNPLAVIPDARGLSDGEMQQIAAEFGYSETTFVFPPDDPAHTARIRIFTPVTEVPFAGHPNVGTAFVLARQGVIFEQPAADAMVFEEHAGLVAVDLWWDAGEVTGAAISAPKSLEIGAEVPVELAAACASLTEDDFHLGSHPPLVLSVGLAFVVARLGDREALSRARPNVGHFVEANAAIPIEGGFALFLYVPSEGDSHHIHARMFAPLDNVLEDPATGSASAALGAFVGAQLLEDDADVSLTIEQGIEMGRPSQIVVRILRQGGEVTRVTVGGTCVPVMHGILMLD